MKMKSIIYSVAAASIAHSAGGDFLSILLLLISFKASIT